MAETSSAFPFMAADHDVVLPLPADTLQTLRQKHPRLLLTDEVLENVIRAAENDPSGLQKRLFGKVVSLAEEDLHVDVEYYMNDNVKLAHKPRTRSPALKQMKNRIVSKVITLAMAFRLTKDARYAEKAIDMMKAACSFPDWFPFHFLTVAEFSFAVSIGYDWLYNYMQEADRQIIAGALYRNCLELAPEMYGKFVAAIDSGVRPTLLARNKHGEDAGEAEEGEDEGGKEAGERNPWVDNMNNQNQIGNGGMLAAALALAELHPDFSSLAVRGAVRSLPLSQGEYYPEGAYPEGPGYWGFGTTYAAAAMAMLDSALGTDFGLSDLHAFNRTVLYRLHVEGPSGQCFNYADSVADQAMVPCFSWLATRFNNAHAVLHAAAAMENMLANDDARPRSKLRDFDRFFSLHPVWLTVPPGYTSSAAQVCMNIDASNASCAIPLDRPIDTPLDARLRGRGVDLAFFRSSWHDPQAAWLALKGGFNTVHHSHLDMGTFVFEMGGVRWAVELGKDSYGLRKYNSHLAKSPRWRYLRPSNRGHNTISVGGEDEGGTKRKEGREGPRPGEADVQCLDVLAPVTHFLSTPDRAHAIVDLSRVYGWPYMRKKAMKEGLESENPRSIHRGVALWNNRSEALIRDEVTVHGSTFKGKKGKNTIDTGDYSFPVVWRMYTEALIVIDEGTRGRTAILHQQGQQMRLEIVSPTPANARFLVKSALPDSLEGVDLSTVKKKQDKPDTEDPNHGVSLLAIELTMSSADVGGARQCNAMGDTCAGTCPCHTLVVAVRLVHSTLSAQTGTVADVVSQPLAAWGGALDGAL